MMREYIDEELIRGTPLRNIAGRYAVSVTALHRHRQEHLLSHLVLAEEAQEVANVSTLLEQIQHLRDRALRLLDAAERAGDLRGAIQAVCAVREVLGLLGQVAALAQKKTEREAPLFRLLESLAERVEHENRQRGLLDG
ncbi:MAG: hypothetical protein RMM06_10295 [Armatimonadota bacterium]|nr:hypothetical protein [Armatimonadota bacterium]